MVNSSMSRMKKCTDFLRVTIPVTRKSAARMGIRGRAASPPPTEIIVEGIVKAQNAITIDNRTKRIQATLGVE